MANKVFLRDNEKNVIMPITRAELVMDINGQPALHSSLYKAKAKSDESDGVYGLMSPEDKENIETLLTGQQNHNSQITKNSQALETLNTNVESISTELTSVQTALSTKPKLESTEDNKIIVKFIEKSDSFTVPYASNAGSALSATKATNADNVYINTSATNSYYPIPFVTSTGAGNKALYMDSSTGTASSSDGLRYNPSSNALYASGGFYESSDNKLKTYKKDIEVDLEKLSKLPKKYFTWKSDINNTLNIGTSAQEVQKLYPELVIDSGGFLAVDYAKLSVIALAAIDKLNEKINLLEQELQMLKSLK